MVKPEKVFISIDMEGISGIVDGSQCGGQTGEYTYGRKLMVGDLNAAIEGALEAGAAPEAFITTIVTTIIMAALPERFRRPLW